MNQFRQYGKLVEFVEAAAYLEACVSIDIKAGGRISDETLKAVHRYQLAFRAAEVMLALAKDIAGSPN